MITLYVHGCVVWEAEAGDFLGVLFLRQPSDPEWHRPNDVHRVHMNSLPKINICIPSAKGTDAESGGSVFILVTFKMPKLTSVIVPKVAEAAERMTNK